MPRTVKYWTTGTRQENFTAVGKPSELIRWTLGFPLSKDIPPLVVTNDVFRQGFRSGGFNGDTHWEPFELSEADYDDFVLDLTAVGYRTVEIPEWIRTETDWMAFVGSKRGIPLEPYRKLLYEFDARVKESRVARPRGKVIKYLRWLRMTLFLRRMTRFMVKYARDPE